MQTELANIELSSTTDDDLMRIKCYAVHEGLNNNGLFLPRMILLDKYKTLVDKPVFIVPDRYNRPTGHGFDYKRKIFIDKIRKEIGHIVDAFPVVVDEHGYSEGYDENIHKEDNTKQLRIQVEIVVSKQYYKKITEELIALHELKKLFFSMESFLSYFQDENSKIRTCTDIQFYGLAIVANPAFEEARSIEVSEEEKDLMEEKYETVLAEKIQLENDKKSLTATIAEKDTKISDLATELANTKQELAEAKTALGEKDEEITELASIKKEYEDSKKKEVGKTRLATLSKFAETTETAESLAEKTAEEFADLLVAAAEKIEVTEVAERIEGKPYFKTKTGNEEKVSLKKFFGVGE